MVFQRWLKNNYLTHTNIRENGAGNKTLGIKMYITVHFRYSLEKEFTRIVGTIIATFGKFGVYFVCGPNFFHRNLMLYAVIHHIGDTTTTRYHGINPAHKNIVDHFTIHLVVWV